MKAGARAGPAYRIVEDTTCAQAQQTMLDLFLDSGPQVAQIQRELVDGEMRFEDTAAGRVVNEELDRLREVKEREIESLKKSLQALSNNDGAALATSSRTEEELDALRAELKQIQAQRDALQAQYNRETLGEEVRRQRGKKGRSYLVEIAGATAAVGILAGAGAVIMWDPLALAVVAVAMACKRVFGGAS